MFALRPRILVSALVALAACGPDTTSTEASATAADPTTSTTSGTDETTASTSSDITEDTADTPTSSTTAEPFDPCACDAPVIHEGKLEAADLAAYQGACLVEVTGQVWLEGIEDPSLLTSLAHLQRAHLLLISDSPGLTDIAPLSCLREVESLYLTDNANLVDIGALERIELLDHLILRNMPIQALPGFAPNYQGLHTLYLEDLSALQNLDPMADWPGLHDGGTVYDEFQIRITDLPKLESIAGLAGPIASAIAKSSLDPADGWLWIELTDLPALVTLDGLETFTRGYLSLRRLLAIKDLAPLANLERAIYLVLAGLPGITSLAGLHSLTQAGDLILGGCEDGETMTSLTSLAGIDALTKISGDLWVVDAPALSDLAAPSLTAVQSSNFVDTPALTDAAIAAFNADVNPMYDCAGDVVECTCLGYIPETVSVGCPQSWSGGSAVIGAGQGGPFNGVTAFFGWVGGTFDAELTVVLLDITADIEGAKTDGVNGKKSGRPKAIVQTLRSYRWWLSDGPELVTLYDAEGGYSEATVELDIQGRLGNWLTPDPADPPRLHGTIKSSDPNAAVLLDGPFDAVFCHDFVDELSD
jgi:hypothetical protein